jgi:hypothetical protein
VVDALADMVQCRPNSVYRAGKLARCYSTSEVVKLEEKLTWSRIAPLVAIDDQDRREELQRECIAKGWNVRELRYAIRGRVGRLRSRGRGGRPSRRPQSLPEALADLDRLLNAIVHWYRGFEHAAASESADPPRRRRSRKVTFDIDQFPPDLRTRLPAIIRGLEDLLIHVEGARDALVGRTDS